MGLSTNAGMSDALTPAQRRAAEAEAANQELMQDAASRGKLAAARREVGPKPILQLEAQEKIAVKDDDGQDQLFDGVAVTYQLEEPVLDESVPSLAPFVLRYDENPAWPFRAPGARAGLKPVMGPSCWEAVLDACTYCIKCLSRHAAPHPAECRGCGLTATSRANAISFLEELAEVTQLPAPNREQRRAMQRAARRPSGLVLPAGVAS